MRLPALFLSALLLTSSAAAQEAKVPNESTVIYLVRHAEKEGEKGDVPLTKAGEKRAEELARVLQDVPLAKVYTSDTERTRKTARPTADGQGVRIVTYDPADPKGMMETLQSKGGHYLVVGHSNNVPEIVSTLGGDPGKDIRPDEFDRLYVVSTIGNTATTSILRYGEPSVIEK